jgi:hypothetical protein
MTDQLTLEDCFQMVDETPGSIDLGNVFPGAGNYLVMADEIIPGVNRTEPDHPKPYIRVPLSIISVNGDKKSNMVGRDFSIFLSLDKEKSKKAQRAPISFTGRSLYRLRNGEFPKNGDKLNTQTLQEWIHEIPGTKFIVTRELYEDDKKVTRSRDTLISTSEWKEKEKLDGTPEADPEQVAAEVKI